jgi:hypothetical protein
VGGEVGRGKAEAEFAKFGLGSGETGEDGIGIETLDPFEELEDAGGGGDGAAAFEGGLEEEREVGLGIGMEEETEGGIAPPAVGAGEVVEEGDGLGVEGDGGGAGSDPALAGGGSGAQTPDAAQVPSGVEVGPAPHFVGEILRMLDGRAVHVGDVQGAVGTLGEVDGAKGVVRGTEDFVGAGEATGGEGGAGRDELIEVDEIGGGIAAEDAAVEAGRKVATGPEEDAAGGGESAGVGIGGGLVGADGEQGCGTAAGGEPRVVDPFWAILENPGWSEEGMSDGGRPGKDEVAYLNPVVTAETPSEVVDVLAELRGAIDGLVFAGIRIDAEIATEIEGRILGATWAGDPTSGQAGGEVYPAIGTEEGTIDAELGGLVGGEPGEDHLADLGVAIAVGVLEPEEIGGAGDEETAAPGEETVGEGKVGGEVGAMVPVAAAGGIGEAGDATEGRAIGGAGGIAAIFGDVEGSGFIPGEGAGSGDQRFSGDEFEGEIGIGLEAAEGADGWVWEGGRWCGLKWGGEVGKGSEAGQEDDEEKGMRD